MLHVSSTSRMPKKSTNVRSARALRIARAALQAAFLVSDDLGAGFAERLFTTPKRHPRPTREQAVLATARPFHVEVALRAPRWQGHTARIAAWRWGTGPTALLVHGWEGRGSQLGALVEPLVAAGMAVVAFDAPGHGSSPGNRLYLTDLADCIADVAAASGPLHAVVAHSFGAAAALLAHARNGLDASRNVVLAPNVLLEDSVSQFARAIALDAPDRALFEASLAEHAGVAAGALTLDHLVGTRDTQLLVVHDRDDREVSVAQGERLAQRWPGAELVLTEGLGHRRVLRDLGVVARVAQFASAGVRPPASDLIREVDRCLARGDDL